MVEPMLATAAIGTVASAALMAPHIIKRYRDKHEPDTGADYDIEEAEAEAIDAAQERYTDPDDDYTILDYENDLEDILDETEEIKADDEDEDEPEDDAGSDEGDDEPESATTAKDVLRDEMVRETIKTGKAARRDRTKDQIKSDIVEHLRQNLEEAVYHGSPLPFGPHGRNVIVNVIQGTLREYDGDATVNAPRYEELSRADKSHRCWTGIEFYLNPREIDETIAGEILVGRTIHIELDDIEETKKQIAESMGLREEYRKATEENGGWNAASTKHEHTRRNSGISSTCYSHEVRVALPENDPRNSTLEMAFESDEALDIFVKNPNGDPTHYHDAMITDISSIGADTLDGKVIGSNVYTVEATAKTIVDDAAGADIDLTGRHDPVDREPPLDGNTMY